MRGQLAADTTLIHYRSMFEAAWEAIPTFSYRVNARVTEVKPAAVVFEDCEAGGLTELAADTVILSVGMQNRAEEALAWYGCAPVFHMIGDCVASDNIRTATWTGYTVASNL